MIPRLADARLLVVKIGSALVAEQALPRAGWLDGVAADIAEAAPIAGLSQTTTAAVSKEWQATRLVAPKTPA